MSEENEIDLQKGLEAIKHAYARANLMMLLAGIDTDNCEESLKWLDDYLLQTQPTPKAEDNYNYVALSGAFLGECIKKRYGGDWAFKPEHGGWYIEIGTMLINPFGKPSKLLDGQDGESLYWYYEMIGSVMKPKNDHEQNSDVESPDE